MISPMRLKKLHSDERGMALVTALLILVALTLLAVTAMTNTTINTMIAGNDYKSSRQFYAAECANELALAAMPDLISGGIPNIIDINSLLHYDSDQDGDPDSDGDGKPDCDITGFLNKKYTDGSKDFDFFKTYCRPDPANDKFSDDYVYGVRYGVRIEDDNDEEKLPKPPKPQTPQKNDPYNDINDQVNLISYKYKSDNPSKRFDQVSFLIEQVLINYDGAVNLIDKDGGVSITMQANSLVDGGINKVGIITTDNLWKDFSHLDDNDLNNGEVDPNGVVQRFNQFVNPSIKDLHDVMSLLTNYRNRTPLKEGDPISLGTSDVAANPSSTIYVRGDVTITNNMSNKVLIIGDYYDSVTTRYQIGLHLETGVTFNGLILLLPDHDVGSSAIPITLSNGAQINGAIIASSYYYDPYDPNYDPNNPLPKSGPGIDLTLNNNAEIIYDYSKIVSTGFERQFAVLKREYLSH